MRCDSNDGQENTAVLDAFLFLSGELGKDHVIPSDGKYLINRQFLGSHMFQRKVLLLKIPYFYVQ